MGILFGLAAIGLSFGVGYAILTNRSIPLELATAGMRATATARTVFGAPVTVWIVGPPRFEELACTGKRRQREEFNRA